MPNFSRSQRWIYVLQSLTIITKRSILDVAAALDPPLTVHLFLYQKTKTYSEESVQRRLCHLIWQLFACTHQKILLCVVLSECLLPLRKGSILLEFVLLHLLYIQNMEICCHLNSTCHLKLFSNTLTLSLFKEYATDFLKDNCVCWTCPKSINLNRNFWCKRHVYYLKELTVNSASSL